MNTVTLSSRFIRWLEMLVLFGMLPLCLWLFRAQLHQIIVPFLLSLAFCCYLMISRDSSFKRFRLFNSAQIRPLLARRLPVFILGGLLCALLVQLFGTEQWFALPRNATGAWLLILFGYPLLSVWPQEIIFRTFFFHRYKKIMPNKLHRAALSALWFAYAHIIYGNAVAILLAFCGGLLFAYTYATTRSTLACVVEHSIWGLWLFTIGLGHFINSAMPQ